MKAGTKPRVLTRKRTIHQQDWGIFPNDPLSIIYSNLNILDIFKVKDVNHHWRKTAEEYVQSNLASPFFSILKSPQSAQLKKAPFSTLKIKLPIVREMFRRHDPFKGWISPSLNIIVAAIEKNLQVINVCKTLHNEDYSNLYALIFACGHTVSPGDFKGRDPSLFSDNVIKPIAIQFAAVIGNLTILENLVKDPKAHTYKIQNILLNLTKTDNFNGIKLVLDNIDTKNVKVDFLPLLNESIDGDYTNIVAFLLASHYMWAPEVVNKAFSRAAGNNALNTVRYLLEDCNIVEIPQPVYQQSSKQVQELIDIFFGEKPEHEQCFAKTYAPLLKAQQAMREPKEAVVQEIKEKMLNQTKIKEEKEELPQKTKENEESTTPKKPTSKRKRDPKNDDVESTRNNKKRK